MSTLLKLFASIRAVDCPLEFSFLSEFIYVEYEINGLGGIYNCIQDKFEEISPEGVALFRDTISSLKEFKIFTPKPLFSTFQVYVCDYGRHDSTK